MQTTVDKVTPALELTRQRAERWAAEDPEYAAVRAHLAARQAERVTQKTIARINLIRKRVARNV